MEQIGKRLRALREGVRLTQVQMAGILGVQQSRINLSLIHIWSTARLRTFPCI